MFQNILFLLIIKTADSTSGKKRSYKLTWAKKTPCKINKYSMINEKEIQQTTKYDMIVTWYFKIQSH